ncbi:right-handed parallel beta-helix repeat-containing protein [Agrobacterium rhizogenes]|nr:right-handed parallel beta-helix repeat-containing protein [Rhizobium rhizogenes]
MLFPSHVSAKACTPEIYAALRSKDITRSAPVSISCDLSLSKNDVILQRLNYNGSKASDTTLDCHGATIDGSARKDLTVAIVSQQRSDTTWDAPSGITLKNCIIKGDLRIQGLTANSKGDWLRLSSLQRGHTERAQAYAPSNVELSNMTFISIGRIPLYIGIGTTGLVIKGSNFSGKLAGTAIYMEAESANNKIIGNKFNISSNRELIAVDGSAYNIIANNIFENPINGGIFLYRNCGENGIIRHQSPQYNKISHNTFIYKSSPNVKPSIWLNSRNGNSPVCFTDPAYPFGSSLSNLDFAKFNIVDNNNIRGTVDKISLIKNDDPTNKVFDNNQKQHDLSRQKMK